MYDISHGVLQYVICVAKIDLELRIAKFAQSELFLTRGEITRTGMSITAETSFWTCCLHTPKINKTCSRVDEKISVCEA